MEAPRSGFCANGEIHYEEAGRGDPLVFIAGLGGVGRFWERQVEAFYGQYRIVLHDHRGTGRSAKSAIRYSIPQMAQDTLAVMDAARISKAIIVGHSTGGAVAQYIAASQPGRVTALVLSATWAWADDYFRALFSLRKEILITGGYATYELLGKLLCHPPSFIASNAALLQGTNGGSPTETILSRIDALLAFDSRPYVSRIEAPTMVIGADDDVVTPPHLSENLAALLPAAQRIRLRSGGHYCPRTVPAEYNAALSQFFNAVHQTSKSNAKEIVQ